MNLNDHGHTVAVFNRTATVTEEFIKNEAKGSKVIATKSIKEFVEALNVPRKILLMVKSGEPVDQFISTLLPLLSVGDVIIDGGNSFYQDTQRRAAALKLKGIRYVGCGISGGEEGARYGPSIMPGGDAEAWPVIGTILKSIAAEAADGAKCCEWMGDGGAGHFVKMVHNGIEYGDMQLICEAYHIFKAVFSFDCDRMASIFDNWNRNTSLNSFLIEITADILKFKDEKSGNEALVERIRDCAGQKGTGKWTVNASLDFASPTTLIAEAVYSRVISSTKDDRMRLEKMYKTVATKQDDNFSVKITVEDVQKALYAAKIISYAQGFALLNAASDANNWKLNFRSIASVWRGGCIIRSVFLDRIVDAYAANGELRNLLEDDYFRLQLATSVSSLRKVVSVATLHGGVAAPAFSAAVAYFDAMTCGRGPANLLQAMRDYFGAHTFEYEDGERGTFHHVNWTGSGGKTTAGSYNA